MSLSSSYKQSLFWANESEYGSASTPNQHLGLIQSINPTEVNGLIKVRTLGGTRDYRNIVPGKFEISGSFEGYLQHGAFLREAFGEDSGTAAWAVDVGPKFWKNIGTAAQDAYVHCMGSVEGPKTTAFPSFTLEFSDEEDTGQKSTTTNIQRVYSGCRVNNLTISANVDDPVKYNCDFLAAKVQVSTAAATSVTQSTLDPFVYYQGLVALTSRAVTKTTNWSKLASSKVANVSGFSFGINNNCESKFYIGGTTGKWQQKRVAKYIIPKGRDYSLTLNTDFDTRKQYMRFLGNNTATVAKDTLSDYNVVIDFVRTGNIDGTAVKTDNFVRLICASCKFTDINIPGAVEDVVKQDLNFSVKRAKCFVVDNDASYKA